jgi:hypothetical protein
VTDEELLQRTLDAKEVTVFGDGRRQVALLVQEVRDLRELFDRLWAAEQRGIKSWQAATGRELTWPDTAAFVLWLLSRVEHADVVIQAARDLAGAYVIRREEMTERDAMALHLALHVRGYDQEYPTPLNDPDVACCSIPGGDQPDREVRREQ